MKAHTQESQATMTPMKSLEFLKEGNKRFTNSMSINRILLEQVRSTSDGQFPFATILSCIDSRVPAELVFDQGVGDIFSIRIAGNFVTPEILGSMEFACKLAGSKLVVVMGHTSCGAVKGACDDAKMGNLTATLSHIKPAVKAVLNPKDIKLRNSSNMEFVDEVALKNVKLTIKQTLAESEILAEMQKNNEIMIVGAMYDVQTGQVDFIEN